MAIAFSGSHITVLKRGATFKVQYIHKAERLQTCEHIDEQAIDHISQTNYSEVNWIINVNLPTCGTVEGYLIANKDHIKE